MYYQIDGSAEDILVEYREWYSQTVHPVTTCLHSHHEDYTPINTLLCHCSSHVRSIYGSGDTRRYFWTL